MIERQWHDRFDLIVVGSGAGAITGAIVAAKQGLKTVIVEKASVWGGSSALSGGGMWLPNNPVSLAAGLQDSFDEALTYMETVIADVGPASSRERKIAFLENGPEMVGLLQNEGVKFVPNMDYPDYYPDKPGGKLGRAIDCAFFDRRQLGERGATLRLPSLLPPIPLHSGEAHLLPKAFTTLGHFSKVVGLFARGIKLKLLGQQPLGLGSALVAQLMYVALRYKVPLWLNAPCQHLLLADDKVVGIEILRDGEPLRLHSQAVLLAAGDFAHNVEMRRKYQGVGADWTVASPDNTGDIIQQCMDIGADMALLDDAWWGAVTVDQRGQPNFILWERSMPHCIVVDQEGRRYTNESASYVDFGHDMLERNQHSRAIPSWLILESRHRNRYIFGMAMPGITPREFIDKGYFIKAATLAELAQSCGIPAQNLLATVDRFNQMAGQGVDHDWQRGRTAYDRFYGDPRYQNPNLGAIERGPFYAVKVYPGDLGTKGGMVTDEHARVLRGGQPIPGLYATGNCAASVMGRTYPGPGSTLGPAMTFAYIAAKHHAASLK